MRILGLDFETEVKAVFDPKQMRITEIGAVLAEKSLDGSGLRPLVLHNEMVWSKEHVWNDAMQDICGYTKADLEEFGAEPKAALQRLLALVNRAEYIVAHNGIKFDKVVLETECERHGLPFPGVPWIDTTCDLPFPKKIETRKLEFLGPVHGFLNPFSHRALFDVLTMLKVLDNYDMLKVVELAKSPNVTVRAVCAKPFGATAERGQKETEAAKARGYRFDGTNKIWVKTIKESQYKEECEALPFQVVIVK